MFVNIEYKYIQDFLPSKRHRKTRQAIVSDIASIKIKEVEVQDFPVAMITHKPVSLYKGAKNHKEFTDDKEIGFVIHSEEIRTYKGELYAPIRITFGAAISTEFENPTSVIDKMSDFANNLGLYTIHPTEPIGQNAILLDNNKKFQLKVLNELAKKYIICDGVLWMRCNEPRYVIQTFGFGHNHGGTGFFIDFSYNSNLSKKAYFNALQYNEAVAYGKAVAIRRGDTESINRIGKMGNEKIWIEVLMPELVKENPQKTTK